MNIVVGMNLKSLYLPPPMKHLFYLLNPYKYLSRQLTPIVFRVVDMFPRRIKIRVP